MDTSETYVQMCRQAKEIQGLWHRDYGDFYYHKGTDDTLPSIETFPPPDSWVGWKQSDNIWLARQDQFQAMLSLGLAELEMAFHDFCLTSVYALEKRYLGSMEQLWLAFVMHKKFGKVWNGSDWVQE